MTTRTLPIVLFAFALATPAIARAQERDGGAHEQLTTSTHEAESALAASDCAAACKALASLRRATDQICKLEPGKKCEAAKAKSDEIAKKVREACPDCALAFTPGPDRDSPVSEKPKEETTRAQGGSAPASPPPPERSESGRGGCASCDVTNASSSLDPSFVGLVVWALSRRRRKR